MRPLTRIIIAAMLWLFSLTGQTQETNEMLIGDPAPDAPELAQRGPYNVGLREVTVINANIPDVLQASTNPDATIDRELPLWVWYPAQIPDGSTEMTELTDTNIIPEGYTYAHRALRDAPPDPSGGPYPLLIISHGLGGSRYQLTYLGDLLASQGYVVVAIDHQDPGLAPDVVLQSLQSATYYRPLDIQFVLDQMAATNIGDSFLSGLVAADNTGLIGYSYGGYGVLVASGAGITQAIVSNPFLAPGGLAAAHLAGNIQRDPRIKAVFAFAPFGMDLRALGLPVSFWDAEGLGNLDIPLFISVGSEDDVAHYETGSVPIFEGAVQTDRYLLTMIGARHNVAPNPPPPTDNIEQFYRHAEPAWRSDKLNNIAQHFVTAFMGLYLKEADYAPYLDLPMTAGDSNWRGFPERSAVNMEFRRASRSD